jgi:hypothetical protein
MRHRMMVTLSILLLAGCDGQRQGGTACGIAALAGPTMLLSEFGVPGQTLSATPRELPERLVARVAAGPAYRAVVGRVDTTWVIGVEGTFEADDMPGFGVLVLDQSAAVVGVMLFAGDPLAGAPILGEVSVANEMIPLIGIKLDRTRFEDPACPFFPDSLLL